MAFARNAEWMYKSKKNTGLNGYKINGGLKFEECEKRE